MKIEITEEEREFLERMCKRAEFLADLNLHTNQNDPQKIKELIKKLAKS